MIKHNFIIHGLRRGEVVGIPTDTVYGLSCIIHPQSIHTLLRLKQRDASKGFIILTSSLQYLPPCIDEQIMALLADAYTHTQSPTTFVVPCAHNMPSGMAYIAPEGTLAVRLTAYPLIRYICDALQGAIISTSANISGKPTITNLRQLQQYFGKHLRYTLAVNHTPCLPSAIINLLTGEQYR